jgi:two-component system C4-dicarboxylate transport sensor histidine kinase DctB
LLRLILANLLQNALEASPPGATVGLVLRGEPERLVAEVSDRGGGIPEAVRARLFEPVRSGKEGGTGIGLAITRQLANYLGAEISLVASSEAGSTFRVSLPRNQS